MAKLWRQTDPEEREKVAAQQALSAIKRVKHIMEGEEYVDVSHVYDSDTLDDVESRITARDELLAACNKMLECLEKVKIQAPAMMDGSEQNGTVDQSSSVEIANSSSINGNNNNNKEENITSKKKKSRSILFGATMGAITACWVFSGNFVFTTLFTPKLKSVLLQNVKIPRAAKCWDDVLNKHKEITLVFDVSDYDEFIAEFGANSKAKKLSWGDLPSSFSDNMYQEDNLSDNRRRGQWGLYCNWADNTAIWFAGPDMTIFKEMSGDEYPFRDINEEQTCPIFMYRFADSVKDFWDNGIGDIFYQLNNVDEFNINNKVVSNQIAAREYNMLTVQTNKKIEAEIGVLEMEEARQQGKVGWLINEVNQGEENIINYQRIGGGSAALDESISLDNLLAEKTTDAGIRLKEVESQKGEPLRSFQIALENANAKARDVNRRNAPEFERMLEYFYQTCLTQVSTSDNTVIDIDEEEVEILDKKMTLKDALKIASAGGKAITNVTRGFAVKMLKEFKPFFKVEPLSGATPNPMIELAKQESLLGILAGTPADIKLRKKMAQELGFSFGEEELQQAIPQAPQTQQVPSQSLLN
jgi:hypothetical protein